MRNTAAKIIFEYCKTNPDGFLIAGDAGFGVWDEFRKELPSQYINPGINEAATIGLAAGMALSGHRVFVYNIIPFVLMRCYEQVRVDICYQNLPVVFIGIGSGITYAPAGMTHYAVEDIALARTMPNLTIISPSDPVQAAKAVDYSISSDSPTYIRISKAGEPKLFDENVDISKPLYLKKHNSRTAIIFHGSIVDDAIKTVQTLKDKGVEVDLISMPMLYPYNLDTLEKILEKYEILFVLEEHFSYGGLCTIIRDFASERSLKVKIVSCGIDNEYIHKIGNRDYLRKHYKIDAESVSKKILNWWR